MRPFIALEDGPIVCLKCFKGQIRRTRAWEHNEVQTRAPLVETEDLSHQTLRPVPDSSVPEPSGGDDTQTAHVLVVRQGEECQEATTCADTSLLHPQELWPAPEALAAGQGSGHVI